MLIANILAIFFGACTLAFMISTIVLSTKYNNKKNDYNDLVDSQAASLGSFLNIGLENPCAGKGTEIKFDNKDCAGVSASSLLDLSPQSGTDVTKGYEGLLNMTAEGIFPVTDPYYKLGMCPVNVHWHLGAEHLSTGQYDEDGKGPLSDSHRRALAGEERLGFRCHHYSDKDERFKTEYDWKYCVNMHVGETYEVHWPHSTFGACGTTAQYQSPFYDGVLCNVPDAQAVVDAINAKVLHQNVGVQGQVFTIINDEAFYYPNLIDGMIRDGKLKGTEITSYTGSTTGTTRDNEVCSQYSPINWQVDRTCHLISASSFDKLCADMMSQMDDMSTDLYPHGSRVLVDDGLSANNHENRFLRK